MASASRRTDTAVIQQLADEPYRFDAFQAVRLIEWLSRERMRADGSRDYGAVGYDNRPNDEVVRFRAHQSHSFPAGSINDIELADEDADELEPLAKMTVSFLGLTGPSGVLPDHYTTLILERMRARDFSLRDYLDLFNHRMISLFYRAWEKYRFPFAYERSALGDDRRQPDPFTQALYSLVGLGTPGLRSRMAVDDEAFLYFSGHFAHYPRSAVALEDLVREYFQLSVQVVQFQGQWLYLSEDEQSRMPTRLEPDGSHCCLGQDVIVGERVWSVENKFRLKLGPLRYREFQRFLPGQKSLQQLCQLVRTYVGMEFDFDVQLVLCAADVPDCQLAADETGGAYLGWNTWLNSDGATKDADDPVFHDEGLPLGTASAPL